MKIDYKQFGIILIFGLVAVTILSLLVSQLIDIPSLKTGPAFILIFIGVFIVYLFIAGSGGIDKKEIITLLLIAGALIGTAWVLKHYIPSIFSIFPSQTKSLFSALGI